MLECPINMALHMKLNHATDINLSVCLVLCVLIQCMETPLFIIIALAIMLLAKLIKNQSHKFKQPLKHTDPSLKKTLIFNALSLFYLFPFTLALICLSSFFPIPITSTIALQISFILLISINILLGKKYENKYKIANILCLSCLWIAMTYLFNLLGTATALTSPIGCSIITLTFSTLCHMVEQSQVTLDENHICTALQDGNLPEIPVIFAAPLKEFKKYMPQMPSPDSQKKAN